MFCEQLTSSTSQCTYNDQINISGTMTAGDILIATFCFFILVFCFLDAIIKSNDA